MSFFKSAFDFVSGGNTDHELVGSYVELGSKKLHVNRVIAEGKIMIITSGYSGTVFKYFWLHAGTLTDCGDNNIQLTCECMPVSYFF